MSKVMRSIKNVTKGYTAVEVKVRNATSNDPWGASVNEMKEIAQYTNSVGTFYEVMDIIEKRLKDQGKNWRHVYKSLKLLDYCLLEGSQWVVTWAKKYLYLLRALQDFQYVNDNGVDVGSNVRTTAKALVALVHDEKGLKNERVGHLSSTQALVGLSTSKSNDARADLLRQIFDGDGENSSSDDEKDLPIPPSTSSNPTDGENFNFFIPHHMAANEDQMKSLGRVDGNAPNPARIQELPSNSNPAALGLGALKLHDRSDGRSEDFYPSMKTVKPALEATSETFESRTTPAGQLEDTVRAALPYSPPDIPELNQYDMQAAVDRLNRAGNPSLLVLKSGLGTAFFLQFRRDVQLQPEVLYTALENLGAANPRAVQLIRQHPDYFLRWLSEGVDDNEPQITEIFVGWLSKKDDFDVSPPSATTKTSNKQSFTSEEDHAALERLYRLTLNRSDAVAAYVACNKDELLAVNMLFADNVSVEDTGGRYKEINHQPPTYSKLPDPISRHLDKASSLEPSFSYLDSGIPPMTRFVPSTGEDTRSYSWESRNPYLAHRSKNSSQSVPIIKQGSHDLLGLDTGGEWICTSCSLPNFHDWTVCFDCGEPNPSGVEGMAILKTADQQRPLTANNNIEDHSKFPQIPLLRSTSDPSSYMKNEADVSAAISPQQQLKDDVALVASSVNRNADHGNKVTSPAYDATAVGGPLKNPNFQPVRYEVASSSSLLEHPTRFRSTSTSSYPPDEVTLWAGKPDSERPFPRQEIFNPETMPKYSGSSVLIDQAEESKLAVAKGLQGKEFHAPSESWDETRIPAAKNTPDAWNYPGSPYDMSMEALTPAPAKRRDRSSDHTQRPVMPENFGTFVIKSPFVEAHVSAQQSIPMQQAVVLHDRGNMGPNELKITTDDVLTDVVMSGDGWYLGTNSIGQRGSFPKSSVRLEGSARDQTATDVRVGGEPRISTPSFPSDAEAKINATQTTPPSTISTVSLTLTTEMRLGDFFPLGKDRTDPYSDAECQNIQQLLRQSGKLSWSAAPRIYIILRIIGQLQHFDSYIDEGVNDLWLPLSSASLPRSLSLDFHEDFLTTQSLVLTKAINLETGGKRHAHFTKSDPFPFEVRETLGKGGFGFVDKVVSPLSGREFARKRFRRARGLKKTDLQSFMNELNILKRLHHIHCVELVASYTDPKYFGILIAPVADCDLAAFYSKATHTDSALIRSFFGCLANAVSFLHDEKIRHRDIKPQNILVKGPKVYLTDFGISLDWESLSRSTTTQDTAKSMLYCAPEVARLEKRNTSADIFSLGCVFLEMLTIIKGKKIDEQRAYFRKCNDNHRFCENVSSAKDWLSQLQELEPKYEPDAVISEIIVEMLQANADDRVPASVLFNKTSRYKDPESRKNNPLCGECCINDTHSISDGGSDRDPFDDSE